MSSDFLAYAAEQLEDWMDGAPTPGTCPAWCTLPAGHPYESRPSLVGGFWTRYHVGASIKVELDSGSTVSFDIEAAENRVGDVVRVSPPAAAMYEPADNLTVDDLSRIGGAAFETRRRLMEVWPA